MELNAIIINKQQEINKMSLNKGLMTFILHSISHLHNCKYKKTHSFFIRNHSCKINQVALSWLLLTRSATPHL